MGTDNHQKKWIMLNIRACSNTSERYTQALHTTRINLLPFTKDFRVWGASIETEPFFLKATLVASP